jgi:sugar/nucleoside kinase (ribokinase family)
MIEIWTMGELLVEIMRPRAGMSLYEPGEFRGPFPSGACGIFIDAVARLGHSAAIISGVGEDDFGRCLLDRFQRDGVSTDFIEVFTNKSTGVAFVTYFEDGSRITFDPNIRFELLAERTVEDIAGPILKNCSILFPGESELLLLGGAGEVQAAVPELFQRYPLEIIVLKRGSRGCTVYTPDGREDIPAFKVSEVDPTGAGDCFDAGFLCGQLEGKSLVESARLAAAVGALNAQAFGPMEGTITRETVAAMLGG